MMKKVFLIEKVTQTSCLEKELKTSYASFQEKVKVSEVLNI